MKLSEARRRLADRWIAFRVHVEGEDPDGEVVFHDADREIFDRELIRRGANGLYLTYGADPRKMDQPIWFSDYAPRVHP